MLLKSQVKYIQTLGHKKFRDTEQVFIAEGPKIVEELLKSDNVQMIQCYATAEWLLRNEILLTKTESEIIEINEKELARISFHSSPNQVLAIFTKPVFKEKSPGGITLCLDTIQDPGNLGTMLRTADWFNVKQVVCSPDTADLFNPKVIQSAMGSIVRVDVEYRELTEYVKSRQDIPSYAASLDGTDLHTKITVREAIILLGNESKGLNNELQLLATKKIRIPKKGNAESLNVSVACGILLSMFETN